MKLLDIARGILSGRGPKYIAGVTAKHNGGLAKSGRAVGYVKNNVAQKNASLASVSSLSVLDPVGIYDSTLRTYTDMPAIMQLSLNIISGYILRAIPFLSDRTNKHVVSVLSQLSPSHSLNMQRRIENEHNLLSSESYAFGLPTKSTLNTESTNRRSRLLGSASGALDANDYGTGKTLEIKIPIDRNESITVQLQVILTARYAEYSTIKAIGEGGSPERGWYERWLKFRSGAASVNDLVTQGDLVSKDVKAAMADKSGTHKEILRRQRDGKIATAFGGKVRYGIGSNLLITSLTTTEKMMSDLRFDMSDYRQRQNIMGAFSCLLWVVVDKEDDYLILYYRDVRLPSEVPLDTVKAIMKKGGSSDTIVEALRSLSANRAPVI